MSLSLTLKRLMTLSIEHYYLKSISPLLFNFYINDFFSDLQTLSTGVQVCTDIINCLLYADDLVLLAETPSDLQILLDKLNS